MNSLWPHNKLLKCSGFEQDTFMTLKLLWVGSRPSLVEASAGSHQAVLEVWLGLGSPPGLESPGKNTWFLVGSIFLTAREFLAACFFKVQQEGGVGGASDFWSLSLTRSGPPG